MRAAAFVAWLAIVGASAMGACTVKQPTQTTYFDRSIAPVLQSSCVRTNTGAGCHVADAKGNAFGNLDVSTFAGVDKRRDLLLDYGPYGQPSLLVKNVQPYQVTLQLWDGTQATVTTDIKHTGGPILQGTASAYPTLKRWIENGATQDNTGVPPVNIPKAPCTSGVPQGVAGFDPNNDPNTPDYPQFVKNVEPLLETSCAAGNCHGTHTNALFFTCGGDATQIRWNYWAASAYAAATPEASELVRRPLATSQGGSYHEGGPLFSSVMDTGYQTLLAWVMAHGAPAAQQPSDSDPGFLFFAQRVQPMLVKKGCMMVQCHSAGMFHEYRLRGGSAGSFSLNTSRRNYLFSLLQLSLESDDVNASRLVRKNLYRPEIAPGSNGLTHRGGPLFEDFGDQLATGALCDQGKYDYDKGNLDMIPAYCVVREWHARERKNHPVAALSGIVYVARPPPPAPDRPQDFDVFAGGATLHIAKATLTPTGDVTLGADAPVNLSACGLDSAADIRRPAVSWDATTIAFAAREHATDPLAIYTIKADGSGCAKQTDIAAHDAMGNGLLEHDFDPTFSPPAADGKERIVFASTRGNIAPGDGNFSYHGPQRTPEDPSKPNANLYAWDPSSSASNHVRQLTYQLDMERLPSFMSDGRLIFTAEKREPEFYQLALRRQNLDGADYHPLYGQRASIGYTQATGVVELADKDFATIFSNGNATHGGGAIAVFNRSIGIDFTSTQPGDYLVDPSVIDPNSPASPEPDFFLHSLSVVANDGAYTSPAPLPDGKMLVSWASGDPTSPSFGGAYDVYVLDPSTGMKAMLVHNAGASSLDAVAIYERAPKGIFQSTTDEPNGHVEIRPNENDADITVLDMRVLGSLLFQNTPTGRPVEPDLGGFEIWEEMPPDVNGVKSIQDCGNNAYKDAYGQVCVNRRLVGHVSVQGDGSAHFKIPGGMPMVLHLDDDGTSRQKKLIRWQREAMTFVPGEYTHQGFPQGFFNNLCGTCHGSISGQPIDAALKPDFLTQASNVAVLDPAQGMLDLADFSDPNGMRGAVQGPPANP